MTSRYYQIHEERLQKEAREKYQNLLEEEKDKRRNKNLSEKKKKNLLTIDKFII